MLRREERALGNRRASLRLAIKVASRTSIRAIGRSTLIAVMVALPVAGLAGVAVVYQSSSPTTEDRLTTELGQTEAMLQLLSPRVPLEQTPTNPAYWNGLGGTETEIELATLLPPDTKILELFETTVVAETATGIASFQAFEGPSWDESLAGRFSIADGRAPRSADEIMVTAALLPRLDAQIGDEVRLRSPVQTTVTVVGVLDAQIWPDSAEFFFGPKHAFVQERTQDARWAISYFLPDLELDWGAVQELNRNGATALSRAVLNDPPPQGEGLRGYDNGAGGMLAIGAIIAGFAAFEVILLAGAAFTVTARQQQRSLATVSSVGATRKTLFRILTANGLVLGAIGGALGIVVGVAGAATFMAVTADGSATQYYGFYIPWLWLLAVAAFAMLIGWIASLVPARTASRFDVVAALRGARKPPTPSKRRPIFGIVMLVVGVALTVVGGVLMAVLLEAGRGIDYGHPLVWVPVAMLIAGPIVAQLGIVLCGPLVLRIIARLMKRAGIGGRLSARDAARNPSRAVPALASIMTTVFVAVFAMCMLGAGQQGAINNHQYRYAVGQIAVPLSYVDYEDFTTHRYDDVEAVADALRTALDVDQLRVLASVPDPVDFGSKDGAARAADPELTPVTEDPVAVPVIPAANLCPMSPASPEFTPAITQPGAPEYRAAEDDWRCAQNYLHISSPTGAHLLVGDADDLALVLDREPSIEARRTLAAGGAVSLYPHYVHDDEFSVAFYADAEGAAHRYWGTDPGEPLSTETLDAVVELPDHPIFFGVFVSETTADRLGLDYSDSVVLASTAVFPEESELDAVREAVRALPRNAEGRIYADVEAGPQEFAAVWMWGLLGLAALIAIAASAVAIGLARFDGRQDDATLSALGARRLVRKNFAFWQAIIIAGLGTLLGAGMGLVPAVALGTIPDIPFAAPWLQIAITVVVLPLVIACGSWLLTGRRKVVAQRMAIS